MKFYKKILEMIANLGFHTAVNAVNVASSHGMHQSEEPSSLAKYKKY